MSRHAPAKCAVLLVPLVATAQAPLPPVSSTIAIRVVQGDGAINSIRLHRGHDPMVQVVDPTGEPLSGATVTFLLPASGPSGSFQGSGLSLTMQTDQKGVATGRGLQPNRIAGQFRIRVTASWRGQTATALVTQTNAEPVASSGHGKWIAILAVVGGGAVAGALAASHGGKSTEAGGTTGGASTGATIVPGTPSIGPPH